MDEASAWMAHPHGGNRVLQAAKGEAIRPPETKVHNSYYM